MQIDGIGAFVPQDARDRDVWNQIAGFVATQPRAFSRDPLIGGHVTGSAFILSTDKTCALLTHHRKLDIWIQLGGHCDGIADARFVALKEGYEESGLARLRLVSDAVFDVDIHEIPASPKDPTHLHYDVRFLMQAEAGDIVVSAESKALAWVPLARMEEFSTEPSLLRMRDRALAL